MIIVKARSKKRLLSGDFNVIPQYNDCKNPTQWMQDALFDSQVGESSPFTFGIFRCD